MKRVYRYSFIFILILSLVLNCIPTTNAVGEIVCQCGEDVCEVCGKCPYCGYCTCNVSNNDENDPSTSVTIQGVGGEYQITVPALLYLDAAGTVSATGFWPEDYLLTISIPTAVKVTNTITGKTETIELVFNDGEEFAVRGSDFESNSASAILQLFADNIKFGNWIGIVTYSIDCVYSPV